MAKIEQSRELTTILRDFVFKDRRIGDQRSISGYVRLVDGDVLRLAAAVSNLTGREIWKLQIQHCKCFSCRGCEFVKSYKRL